MDRLPKIFHSISGFAVQSVMVLVRGNSSSLASSLRRKIYRTACTIETNVVIRNPTNFRAGDRSALYHACYILNDFGRFSIGANSHLGAFCYVNVCYGEVTIGEHVAVGPGTKIIAYSNHFEEMQKVTDTTIVGNVSVGNNVFIGANCTILPGTVIQDNVVIGAGAVVKGVLKSNAVYGGIPCKMIRDGWYE